MKFTVIWKLQAEQQLTTTWLDAVDREAVTQAAATIERMLQTAPESVGESRSDKERVVLVLPLAVYFEVHPDDRIVYVLSVRYLPPHAS